MLSKEGFSARELSRKEVSAVVKAKRRRKKLDMLEQ